MTDTFKIGDVVKLKSGSPKMTVTAVGDQLGTAKVWCSWFDDTKQLSGVFPPEGLDLI
jgi:uncharacterized protein YodC (DUF2158 family)